MSRIAAGAAGVALFAAAAFAGVWLLTRDEGDSGPAPAGPREAPESVAPAAPAPAAPSPLTLFAPPPPIPQVPVVMGPPPPEPPRGSWEAVPLTARAHALGPLGGAVGRGLIELQPRLSACFDEDTQARHAREAYSVVRDAAPSNDAGSTVLVLQIETGAGEARIVDAPLESRGGASDGLVACAQRALRGQRFAVPQAKAGQRFRLLHPLTE